MELLIVITIIALLGTAAILLLNPQHQIEKAWDGRRKAELSSLRKVLEDWYGDKNCYPRPVEICYPSTASGYNPSVDTKCYFCGSVSGSPQINPYLSQLPCDPRHPTKKYLYQVDDATCPSYYRIYDTLSDPTDPVIAEVGCVSGCGPVSDPNYNYGVSSPNVGLERLSSNCLTSGTCDSYCNSIGGKHCVFPGPSYDKFSDSNCQNYTGFCSGGSCCGNPPAFDINFNSFKCRCH